MRKAACRPEVMQDRNPVISVSACLFTIILTTNFGIEQIFHLLALLLHGWVHIAAERCCDIRMPQNFGQRLCVEAGCIALFGMKLRGNPMPECLLGAGGATKKRLKQPLFLFSVWGVGLVNPTRRCLRFAWMCRECPPGLDTRWPRLALPTSVWLWLVASFSVPPYCGLVVPAK